MPSILDLPSGSPSPDTPDLVTPTPTSEELAALEQQANLLDTGNGFTLKEVRPFYPGVGWNVITARLEALITAGKLRKRFTKGPQKGSGWETYTVIR